MSLYRSHKARTLSPATVEDLEELNDKVEELNFLAPGSPNLGRRHGTGPGAYQQLARIYNIPIPPQLDLPISYNIAPSQNVLAIRFNAKSGQRSLDALRWGFDSVLGQGRADRLQDQQRQS
jgi:hypothetical protein